MRDRIRSLTMVVFGALAVTAMMTTAAIAQEYPPGTAFAVSCTDATMGGSSTCGVVGAQPGETLDWTAENGGVFASGNETADANGEATFSFDVPDEAGDVTVTVEGSVSGVTVLGVVTVADPADTDPGDEIDEVVDEREAPAAALPITGGQVAMLSLLGLVLLIGGGVALKARQTEKVSTDA